jgi:hypothetical protein
MQADGHGIEPQGLKSNRCETTYRPKRKEASGGHAPQARKWRRSCGRRKTPIFYFIFGQRLACFWLLKMTARSFLLRANIVESR